MPPRLPLKRSRPRFCNSSAARRAGLATIGIVLAALLATTLAGASAPGSDLQPNLRALLAGDLKFSSDDLADLERGKIVKHALPASAPGEVAAVGGVRIRASKDRFAAAYRDIVRFKKSASVLEIGRFGSTPQLSDLDALTITHDDFDLRECRVGDCEIRLPADVIQRIASDADWQHPGAEGRAATLFKRALLDNVRSYVSGGPGRITEYDDDKAPIRPVEDFHGVLKSSPYVEQVLPGLSAHLSSYPAEPIAGGEDFLYWSKEKFGIAPFISVTHVTLVTTNPHQYVATTRDVYSSRYFDASLALVIASDSVGDPRSFYLFYINRSRASALRGSFARIRRSIVERRVKGSLEDNLRAVKARLESNLPLAASE